MIYKVGDRVMIDNIDEKDGGIFKANGDSFKEDIIGTFGTIQSISTSRFGISVRLDFNDRTFPFQSSELMKAF